MTDSQPETHLVTPPAAGRLASLAAVIALAATLALIWRLPALHPFARGAALAGLMGLAAFGAFELAQRFLRPGFTAPMEPGRDELANYHAGLDHGLLLARADGSIAFSNQAFWRMLGTAPVANSAGFRPAEIFGALPASSEAAYRLTRAQAAGSPWEEVIEQPFLQHAAAKLQGAAGLQGAIGSRWLRIAVSHHHTLVGNGYSAWQISDVTQENTRQSESLQRMRHILDQLDRLPAGLFVAAPDGRLTYMNATLTDWVGAANDSTGTALSLERCFATEGLSAVNQSLAVMRSGEGASLDIDLLRQDGVRIPARLMARAHTGEHRLGLGLVVNRAPTDRPEDGTQAAEARFTRFFHAAPIAIATIDAVGLIGSANPAFTRMFFGRASSINLNGSNVLERLREESRAAVREALLKIGRQEAPQLPIEIVYGDGAPRSGQLFLSANTVAGAERESVIVYGLDTTDRKELEVQFAQSQKMQAIGQLAGGIAHDINNVLTVIIGFSDLLLANSGGDPAFHDLNEIKANANRAANLVRQLLAFSRRQTLRPEVLSLNEVISDLTVFLKRSLGEKVKLERDYGRDLWLVKADQTELGRVLVNLAVNAVDAMADGGSLTIRTANIGVSECVQLAERGMEPGDYVMCAVTDTGHGMTSDVLQKIFEPFFTTKDVGKGTGLGLSTVYGIVKQTGGYIYCDSAAGSGTTFRIYLPRHIPGAGSGVGDIPNRTEKRDNSRDLTGTGTILLVEDEESVRRFAARALRRQGYAVLEAGNGYEALEVKGNHAGTIDLVVSDIVMPEMDGPALLKELRKTNPELKIIFMSGYADDALSSLDSGEEFAFLSKPFQLTELVTAVKELISG